MIGWFTIARVGLILNFVGTVMVACSFGTNLEDAYQTDKHGRRVYLASFRHPWLFYAGLSVIALGFLVQLVV